MPKPWRLLHPPEPQADAVTRSEESKDELLAAPLQAHGTVQSFHILY